MQRTWTSPSGHRLLDFGQNLVGWLRIRVQGPAGTEITVRHAEVLEHDELGTRPLRSAEATDRFVLSGGDDEFEPTFTFHGFRYAQIDGWPGEFEPAAVTAVVIGSELDRIGTFRCSDELLNRFHENVVWGMRGNFVDVPTD
ncbi:MAG TPA: family 78 glycoside hydrolase catalytic domain, partial [Amnibacterium sp.]|nr:family 78 glycoside hydrolase catalytic domain [Amnibacterium sp.]